MQSLKNIVRAICENILKYGKLYSLKRAFRSVTLKRYFQ